MARTDQAVVIKLPSALKERLRKAAEDERRSMNGQAIYLLERALPAENEKTPAAVTAEAQ